MKFLLNNIIILSVFACKKRTKQLEQIVQPNLLK